MKIIKLWAVIGAFAGLLRAAPLLEKSDVFPTGMAGIALYRIPGIVV